MERREWVLMGVERLLRIARIEKHGKTATGSRSRRCFVRSGNLCRVLRRRGRDGGAAFAARCIERACSSEQEKCGGTDGRQGAQASRPRSWNAFHFAVDAEDRKSTRLNSSH